MKLEDIEKICEELKSYKLSGNASHILETLKYLTPKFCNLLRAAKDLEEGVMYDLKNIDKPGDWRTYLLQRLRIGAVRKAIEEVESED